MSAITATPFGRLPPEYPAVRGAWESDPSHFPLPLTPAFASLYLPWQDAALSAMFRVYGYLGGTMRSRLIDGRLYYRVTPAGGWTPPRWLSAYAAWFWPFSPVVAVRVLRARQRRRSRFGRRVLERWRSEWRERIEAEHLAAVRTDLTALAGSQILRMFDTACARTGRNIRLHFLLHGAIAPALFEMDRLLQTSEALAGVRLQDLLSGASPASSAPANALMALARDLAGRPSALARARALGPAGVAAEPERVDAPFAVGLRRWLEQYGHRVLERYEFIEPAVAEHPERVVARILAMAHGRATPSTVPAAADAARAARCRLEAGERRRFDALLAEARAAYAVRDDNVVLTYNASFAVLRYLLLEIGRRMAGDLLASPQSIFFLTADEIRTLLAEPECARARGLGVTADARWRIWELRLRQPPPPTLGPPVALPSLTGLPRDAAFMTGAIVWYLRSIQTADAIPSSPAGLVLKGLGASAGRYRGLARIIRGMADFERLAEGEVLVCTMTSPAWSAILPLAGALVTEHGGPLSHPAVIARELGIPAVVGLRSATTVIIDGSEVIVDGSAGLVEPLR